MSASALLAVSLLTVTMSDRHDLSTTATNMQQRMQVPRCALSSDDELTVGILPDEVPSFRPDTPGDNCDDQVCMSPQHALSRAALTSICHVAACCCNSVSWALRMLCMK